MDQPGTHFIHMFFVSSAELAEEFEYKDPRSVAKFAEAHQIKGVKFNKLDWYPKRQWLRAMLIEAGEDPATYEQGR